MAEKATAITDDPASTPARWAAWRQWKRRCALGLCDDPVRSTLTAFAAARFRKYLSLYAARTAPGAAAGGIGAAEAWHRFETHLRIARTAGGKAYKSWLFARVRTGADVTAALDTVQGGASNLIRTAARRYMAQELPDDRDISLDRPLAAPDGLSLQDVLPGDLPDPSQEAAGLDLERIAAAEALRRYDDLTARERIAAAARDRECPLSHPAVLRAAGCRKSVLFEAYHAMIRRVTERIRMDFRTEDPGVLHALAARVMAHLHRIAAERNPEMCPARGFRRSYAGAGGRSADRRPGSFS